VLPSLAPDAPGVEFASCVDPNNPPRSCRQAMIRSFILSSKTSAIGSAKHGATLTSKTPISKPSLSICWRANTQPRSHRRLQHNRRLVARCLGRGGPDAKPTLCGTETRPKQPPSPTDDAVAMRPCAILELDDSRCHWPLGEMHRVATQFCGGAATPGRRYCAHHGGPFRAQKRAFSSLPRMGCPARGAVRRLRTVGGIGVVLGYSRDEPAGGERLQVCLHRVSNIVGIDLRSSALGIDWRYHRVRAAQVFAMKSSRS